MARGRSHSSSLRRLFYPSSPPVDDDLADLEESFRNSSFVPVPSALTPSRASSNSIIAATRALFFNRPVPLDFPSGWDKGPVTDWYKTQRAKGSTVIEKIQLRKDHQRPYYHEYIVISTRNGHTYRIDRRPDPDTPFDTIMKKGCIAHDTIQELDSTSLKELDSTSSCVVELQWQNGESIDLLSVLSICFAIRNDKWADRYTLQRYNCYFLSWAIISITMRKSVVCRAVFDTREVPGSGRARERDWAWVRNWGWKLVVELIRAMELAVALRGGMGPVWVWAPERAQVLGRALAQVLARAHGRERGREPELALVVERERVEEWAEELARDLENIPLVLGLLVQELRNNPAIARTFSFGEVVFVILLFHGLIYSNVAWRSYVKLNFILHFLYC